MMKQQQPGLLQQCPGLGDQLSILSSNATVRVCSMKGEAGDRIRKNPLGLGLLLGGAVFSYGRSCGCKKAEILAINDDGEGCLRLWQCSKTCNNVFGLRCALRQEEVTGARSMCMSSNALPVLNFPCSF
jgi:hypothetical protein